MSDKGHQEFIEHACESFKEDDELALVAKRHLRAIVQQSNADFQQANQNLKRGLLRNRKTRAILMGGLAIFGVIMLMVYVSEYRKFYTKDYDKFLFQADEHSSREYKKSLPLEEQMVLYGDPKARSFVEAAESRWQGDPENALYYIEYAYAFCAQHSHYPEDMLDVAGEIDPDNSAYLLCKAGKLARKVVETERRSGHFSKRVLGTNSENKGNSDDLPEELWSSAKMVVKDQAGFKAALSMIYQAAEKAKYTEYEAEFFKERVPLVTKKNDTYISHLSPLAYVASFRTKVLDVRMCLEVIKTEAQRCAQEKDVEGLRRLIAVHESLSKQLNAKENVSLVRALVARAFVHGALPYFRDAAAVCGLNDLQQKYEQENERFEEFKKLLDSKALSETVDLRKNGSRITSIALPLVAQKVMNSKAISPVDHRPLRVVENVIMARFLTVYLWLFLLVTALVFFVVNLCKGKLVKGVSNNLLGVLSLRDWMIVLSLGIVAPIGVFYYFYNFTSLSVTQYNIAYLGGLLPMQRFACLTILLLCCQVLVLEWRIAKLTAQVFGKQGTWLVWLVLVGSLVIFFMQPEIKWSIVLGVGVFLLASLVFLRLLPGLFSFKNCIMNRAMVLSLLMSSAVLTLLFPVYKAQEHYWIAKDEVLRLSPDRAAWTKLEGEVTQQFIKETRDLMGWSEVE